jgi:hypothetical protein
MRVLHAVLWVVLGFSLYPLLFIPLLIKFQPDGLEKWIVIYAHYLRLWGI